MTEFWAQAIPSPLRTVTPTPQSTGVTFKMYFDHVYHYFLISRCETNFVENEYWNSL